MKDMRHLIIHHKFGFFNVDQIELKEIGSILSSFFFFGGISYHFFFFFWIGSGISYLLTLITNYGMHHFIYALHSNFGHTNGILVLNVDLCTKFYFSGIGKEKC